MHVRPPVLCIVLQSSQNIASYFLHHDCFETRSARVKTRHRIKTQNTQKPNCIWWTFKPRTETTHTEGDNCDRHSTEIENLFADYSTCCSVSLIIEPLSESEKQRLVFHSPNSTYSLKALQLFVWASTRSRLSGQTKYQTFANFARRIHGTRPNVLLGHEGHRRRDT